MDLRGIELASISSTYVGGRRITQSGKPTRKVSYSSDIQGLEHDPNDTYHVEQAYLQHFIPVDADQRTPILLVHGGGYSGACWETTPDGRSGWLTFFLRKGVPVSVLDNVERGRAGWCSLDGVWPDQPILRGERDMWTKFRLGPEDGYAERRAFPGIKFPINALATALTQTVPRWPANDDLAFEGLRDAVRHLGRCVLIGHSQGGGLCARVALAEPDLVRCAVLLEPHGFPALPASGPVPPMMTIVGDYIDQSPLWTDLVARMREFAHEIRKTGSVNDLVDLPEFGVTGNSHNMMMDMNSDEVAEIVWSWLRDHDTNWR